MASGQTENFGLNQWEAGDPVLREEFNQDNQKIEAAFKEVSQRMPLVRLGSWSTVQETSCLEMDLSGIDRDDYLGLRLFLKIPNMTGTAGLRLNRIDAGYSYQSMSSSNSEYSTFFPVAYGNGTIGHVDLYTMGGTVFYSTMIRTDNFHHQEYRGFCSGAAVEELVHLQLTGSSVKLGAGTQAILFGLRF